MRKNVFYLKNFINKSFRMLYILYLYNMLK